MATVSTLERPRKLVRYGKATGRSTFNASHVDAFMEDELATNANRITQKTSIKDSYTIAKPSVQAHPKAAKSRAKKQDTFDVPSSDDEVTVPQRVVPLKITARTVPVDDARGSNAALAPWERKKVATPETERKGPSRRQKYAPPSPDDQLKYELTTVSAPEYASPSRVNQADAREKPSLPSAAARLAARRRAADDAAPSCTGDSDFSNTGVSKRAVPDHDDESSSARKRLRQHVSARDDSEDVVMSEVLPASGGEQSAVARTNTAAMDVYDIPNSDNEDSSNNAAAHARSTAAPRIHRRHKLTSPSSRSKPTKGLSAPARLTEMLPTDTDTTDTTSPLSPATSASRPATPHRPSSSAPVKRLLTPTTKLGRSPDAHVTASGGMTPKQVQIWGQLLQSEPPAPTPSALRMKELTISGARRSHGKASTLARTLPKSRTDVPDIGRRRTRLVDRLKASAESSEEDSDSDNSDIQMQDTMTREDSNATSSIANVVTKGPAKEASQTSHSQHRLPSNSDSGPKVTYARTRSHLPEDNFEDGLMADLPSTTPQRAVATARRTAQPKPSSQDSTFDLEDSDDEGGAARLRTIHELRAAGRHHGFTQDVHSLLEDISNHATTARSRRRSALIELATKLAEKSFAERFVVQDFEHRLLNECTAVRDDIADFALAAVFALMLSAEPPEHTVTSLKHGGALDWLAGLLHQRIGVVKLAKERKNNVSKSAQSSIREFCDMLLSNTSLWTDVKPPMLSSRTLALKALDLLVGRLRRFGDKNLLLDDDQLRLVIWTPNTSLVSEASEYGLSISVLEALSTSSLTLTWPDEVLERLAESLPELLGNTDLPTKTMFLALRLTLNLTNDDSLNCDRFASLAIIDHLMLSIQQGFGKLETPADDQQQTIDMDLLVLAMVIVINIAEHSEHGRELCVRQDAQPVMSSLVSIFRKGQDRTLQAESVEEAVFNIPFGYLSVMFANLCTSVNAKVFIASRLADQNLDMLRAAVVEFIMYHQAVDMMSLEGEEGKEVRSGFTERLKAVLERLQAAATM